jgi:threonine aldolase
MAGQPIDLRSDTVTQPTPAMRTAMATAAVGDDVYGEDPTVNRLEQEAAALLGMEATLFVTSGTQANLLAILCHCQRGDEYIAGQTAHCYRFEGGGAAVLGGVQPQPLDFAPDGTLDLDQVVSCIKPDDPHFPRTRLLCLENTQAGKALPLDYLAEARRLTTRHGLALHLDGARLFNAAVAQNVAAREILQHVDSAAVCLSKGLGAPVGSLLCGSHGLIARARRWRKMLGGGMRQAGVLAAAGLIALLDGPGHLANDHRHARRLAAGLAAAGYPVRPADVQTNMVFVPLAAAELTRLTTALARQGILIAGRECLRLVTHRDVSTADIDRTVAAFAAAKNTGTSPQEL